MRFNKNGDLIPQIVKYKVKHEEATEEMLDEYIKKKTDFQIDYEHEGNARFTEKEKK